MTAIFEVLGKEDYISPANNNPFEDKLDKGNGPLYYGPYVRTVAQRE